MLDIELNVDERHRVSRRSHVRILVASISLRWLRFPRRSGCRCHPRPPTLLLARIVMPARNPPPTVPPCSLSISLMGTAAPGAPPAASPDGAPLPPLPPNPARHPPPRRTRPEPLQRPRVGADRAVFCRCTTKRQCWPASRLEGSGPGLFRQPICRARLRMLQSLRAMSRTASPMPACPPAERS